MKTTSILGLATSAAMLASASAATLQVDFNDLTTETTQAGWEAFDTTVDPTNQTRAYGGYDDLAGTGNSISVTSLGVTHSRVGGIPTTPTGLDNMYRDLVLNNAAGVITLTISGLVAGDYYFQTYHHVDSPEGDLRSSFDLEVQDGDSPAFGQLVGDFKMGGDDVPVDSGLFTVNSNGTDDIILRMTTTEQVGNGGQDWIGVNGMEITNVPEPGSLVLLGLGGLGLLARRRRA